MPRKLNSWTVLEYALNMSGHDQAWLAKEIRHRTREEFSAAAITNWKRAERVPQARHRLLSEIFDGKLTRDQLELRAPPPWEQAQGQWPFPGIDQTRWEALKPEQRVEIQGAVRLMIEKFEAEKAAELGKSYGSQSSAHQRKSA